MEDFKGIATRSSHKDVRQTLAKIFMPDPLVAGGDLRVSWWVFTSTSVTWNLQDFQATTYYRQFCEENHARTWRIPQKIGQHFHISLLSKNAAWNSGKIVTEGTKSATTVLCECAQSICTRTFLLRLLYVSFLVRYMIYANFIYITFYDQHFHQFRLHHLHQHCIHTSHTSIYTSPFTGIVTHDLWHKICSPGLVL